MPETSRSSQHSARDCDPFLLGCEVLLRLPDVPTGFHWVMRNHGLV